MATSTPRTTFNQMEQGEDPSCLLRESNTENPEEVMTDQINLGSSLKHRGAGHGLPTLPEDLPLNMSNKEVKTNAGSSNFTPSWRANAHLKPSSPGGEGAHGDDRRGDCCWCCSCCPCCRNCRCHPALARVLSWIYEKTAGPLAYCLFFALIYVCLWIFTGKEALPPKCYEYKRINAPVHEGLSAKKMEKPVAFCEGGKSLNILILYMFAVLVGQLTELIRLPGLVGMLLSGVALHCITVFTTKYDIMVGPAPAEGYEAVGEGERISNRLVIFASILNVDKSISAKLRQIALATILTRAGLGLDPAVLKQVCGGVARMALIPCVTEAVSAMVISKYLLDWPWAWAAMLGFVLSAVSPAVVVPNMIRLEVAGWGVNHGIPTLIMAASSMDDVVAITGFGVALSIAFSKGSLAKALYMGPLEVAAGAVIGLCMGILFWFLPPPGMEHCNVLRGSCLYIVAVAAIVGTVQVNLPGAGALACLVFSVVVSIGWQHGMPWRLMRHRERKLTIAPDHSNTSLTSFNNHHVVVENEHHDYYRQYLRRLRRKAEQDRGNALAAVSKGRRFSLPEPKPAYETDEFYSHRQYTDFSEGGYGRSLLNRSLSSRHNRQRNNSSPVMRWRTISETPAAAAVDETSAAAAPGSEASAPVVMASETPTATAVMMASLPEESQQENNNGPASGPGSSAASSNNAAAVAAVPTMVLTDDKPTANERGMACMKTMRSFMATVWWFVQPLLFCLIGADVAVEKMRGDVVGLGIAAICSALGIRLIASFLAVTPSRLTYKERVFVALAWMPKATVQAAIGPLALDAARKTGDPYLIDLGEQILTLAALSILITAPLGASLMMLTAPCLLTQDRNLLEVDNASGSDQTKRGDAKLSKANSLANRPRWRI